MSGLTLEIFRDGKKEGRAEGRVEGRAEGRAEGIAEGMEKGVTSTIFSLVKEGLLTISVAAKKLNMTEAEVKKLLV